MVRYCSTVTEWGTSSWANKVELQGRTPCNNQKGKPQNATCMCSCKLGTRCVCVCCMCVCKHTKWNGQTHIKLSTVMTLRGRMSLGKWRAIFTNKNYYLSLVNKGIIVRLCGRCCEELWHHHWTVWNGFCPQPSTAHFTVFLEVRCNPVFYVLANKMEKEMLSVTSKELFF